MTRVQLALLVRLHRKARLCVQHAQPVQVYLQPQVNVNFVPPVNMVQQENVCFVPKVKFQMKIAFYVETVKQDTSVIKPEI